MHKNSIKDKIGMILFLAPALLVFTAFFIYPVGFLIVTSFTKWDGMSAPEFIGFANYTKLFADKIFHASIINNLGWVFAGGFIQVPLAVLVAIILSKKPKGWKFLRTVYYFPNVVSVVAMSMMWMAIYNSEYGVLNALLKLMGLEGASRNWLGDLKTAYPAVLLYGVFYIGYFMIIILADISSIPKTYYEAAEIDGATKLKQDMYITLPLIKGSIATCMTLAMVYGLRQFEQTFIMTNGGPANKTTVMVLYLYKKINDFQYGIANASGVILLILGVFVISAVKKLINAQSYEM
ncbi:carbohydrate ABC transporter permease [Clostridium grantii]|uniref:Raffinose/stachyose/melibiose transport system permease protein n=1 Tax=Clostridium grantii DSM 8605 TaxID=1121316 RepID=A0A1M5UJS8_9CLOT|nr:sugar ABC transporter permease [Clostridium grantii]SHH63148.1 raffinose/stachyose/melibiose transport system permease protein [Clostridium grantii DSM 8605]